MEELRMWWRRRRRWKSLASVVSILLLFGLVGAADASKDRHPLVFTRTRYNASIYENNIGKSYVTAESERMGIQLSSATATPQPDIRYRIVAGDKNKLFRAESRLVGDFSFLLLRTRTGQVDVLNRERADLHKLRIRASIRSIEDGSDIDLPGAEADVWVYVLDTNDLSPLFYPAEYEVNVPEDAPLHTSLVAVKADDADVGINGEIYYSLAEPSEQFAVHPLTGAVSLTRPLVFAEQPFHELVVLAQDRGPQLGALAITVAAASRAKVRIHVLRVNQHEPRIYVKHLPEVVEQSQVDVYAVVRVEDADQGPSGQIRSLEIIDGDPDGYFRVQKVTTSTESTSAAEFNIAVLKLLDRERAPAGYNLTLRAVDGGTPPRNSTATLHVTVADWNDHAPVFDREHYEVSVIEIAPVGTPLIRLKVTDQDQGRNALVQLSIVGGNQGGHFRINPTSGVLYTAQPLDAEMRTEHVLTVSAIDQGTAGTRKQSSAKVTVRVLDANDNDPVFYQQPSGTLEVQVDENEPAGVEVTRAVARDADAGENGYISYSLANLAPVPFEVDPFTGAVRTTDMLDYETGRRRYTLKIRASDWGTPYRRQSELQVTIRVRDINDNRPQFQRVGCVGRVPRTTAIGSELLTLSAVDFDQGNTVSYRIVSGSEDGCFGLDSSAGVLRVGCDLSDLGISERYVNVTATDGQHFADIQSIKIHLTGGSRGGSGRSTEVTEPIFECRDTGLDKRLKEMISLAAKRQTGEDLDESVTELPPLPSRYGQNIHSPEFYNFPAQVRVNESVASGTPLVRLTARDRDHGYNGLLVFVISGGDETDSAFQVDMETGLLKVVGRLDRERRPGYSLNLTVFDLGQPQRSAWRVLPVAITDVNDNPPRFDRPVISVSIAETSPAGTSVAQVSASDADEGDNARVSYHLSGGETPDFKLDPSTGLLTVSGQLDRERRDFYELAIVARDGLIGSGLSSKALIRIRILDVNDVAPRFARPWQVVKIREDMPVGAVVALMDATDPDLGLGGQIRYTLASSYASETVERFSIDRLTGTVRLARRLDFEERQLYNLTVRAKDRGSPSLSSEASLAVEVVDVNENLYAPRFEDFVMEASVKENSPPGTVVTKVTATDADPPGDDSRLSYFIRGGTGLGLFSIDNEGTIRTRAILDRETKGDYWLTVVAQDHGIATLSASIEVFIEVLDENDHIPLTVEPIYWVHVAENSPPKTSVVRITAQDGDGGGRKLTFQLKAGNPQSLFDIDPNTGNITTTGRRLDRENLTEHILEVMVIDSGVPALSSSTRVVVTVDDVNDNAPEFLERFYKIQIPATLVSLPDSVVLQNETEEWLDPESNSTSLWITSRLDNLYGQPVFRVEAFDRDSGDNGRVDYSLMETASTKGRFRIHPHSGVVHALKSLTAGQEFSFTVRASDRGRPSRNATTRVSVTVLGVPQQSENPPELGSDNSRRADVMESDPVGHAVAFITANDPDGDMLWYKIEDGNVGDKFALQTTGNGKVYVAQPLDWEERSFYSLNISITDGANTIYTQLDITVLDVNDHAPVFSEKIYRAEVSENAEIGTEVVQLNATDADQDKRVFYALHTGASATSLRKFKVDSTRGMVTLAEKLDRETMSRHILTVSVKDQGTPSKRNFARLVIDVTDHNDHAPEFMSELVQVRIFETASVGSVVTAMLAMDKDRGNNAKIVYTINAGNVGGAFVIEPDSGLIRVNQPLDVGTAHEYMLVVKATDGGTPALSTTCRVHILITMAENDPPKFLQNEYTADVFEDAAGGTFVVQVEGRSISSLLFEIVGGNGDDAFTINPSTGIIVVSPHSGLDYERMKHYNLSISAMNMAGASARCRVLVHVLDVNDNSPSFSQELYEGTIMESSPAGSLVFQRLSSVPLVVSAKDRDAGVNALLAYDIVESRAAKLFAIDSSTGAVRTIGALDREQMSRIEFSVQVSDHGRPRRFSDQVARVLIHIQDVNDSPPKFIGRLPYSTSLLLPTFAGVAVLQVRAEDPDTDVNSTLHYEITGGNEGRKFVIDRKTGWISVADADGLASSHFFTLEISVTDGKYTTTTNVEIQLEKVLPSGLAFAQDKYTGHVTENSTRGPVTIVALNVLGTLLNEHVSFAILNPQGLFQVGATSGVVQTVGELPFDREVQSRYVIIVEARSERGEGEKPRVAHTRVEIDVMDINDNRPVFFNLPYYAVFSIDAPKGNVVTKVQAVDKDIGENGDIRYELVRGSGELFRVDRRTGEILLRQTLEGQQHHSSTSDYELLVAAYDGGTPPLSSEALVRIKVVDKNQPVFGLQYYSAVVSENAESLSPVLSVQASSPSGRQLIYSIVSGNEGEEFAVDFNTAHNSENGPCLIYIVNQLDYEIRSKYELVVRATDSVSGVHSEVPVSVSVEDANDSPPEFSHNEYNVTLSEATPFGTTVLAVTAIDQDSGENAEVIYRLLPDALAGAGSEFFQINAKDGTLVLSRSLDRETLAQHHLLVMASDQGIPSLSSTAHIWIRVEDVNDNPPQFEQRSYRCSLSEDAKRNQFVTMVTATDPDASDQSRLLYSITGGNDHQIFNIEPKRGMVTLGNLHRFGEHSNYLLNISVSDGVFTNFATLQIDLLSTNRHSPIFSRPLYEVEVTENSPAGALVVQLNASDADRDDFGHVTYAILSSAALELFKVDEETGDIVTRRPLDRETRKLYEIPVAAFDAGGKSGHAVVRVKVGDVNDNRPKFLLAEYRANIHANYSVGQPFLKVQALDLDVDDAGKITYSIYESNGTRASETFDLNPVSGELFLKQSALNLANEVFQFFVRAEDSGSPSLGTEAPVDVLILETQERAPAFERTSSKYFISESAPVGTTIARVKASNNGEPLHYSIVPAPKNSEELDGGKGKKDDKEDDPSSSFFSVDDEGQIYLSAALDRETNDIHIITVLASTEASPPVIAFTEVIIQVLDINEHPPEFESNPYHISVAENAEKGTSVIRVAASDGDRVTGTYGDLRYSFGHNMAPELANVFRLDSVTGWITTLGLLDREECDRYVLPIVATDNGSPAKLTSTTAVIVEVKDYNDNPPQFSQSHYVAAVNEEALPGTVVVRLTTTDRDRFRQPDQASAVHPQLQYYIVSGDPRAQFGVRQGEVYVERALDREEIGSYNIQVLATDGFFQTTTHVTIDILDDNDNPPYCTQHRYNELLSESTPAGTFIVRIRATDADEGANAKMRFYLTGEASEFFSLDATSGQLKTFKILDRETRPIYSLTAHVQDRERPQWECTSEVVITLLDVNDNAPQFGQDWYTFAIPEDAELRTIVGKVHAVDSDVGMNRKVRYGLPHLAAGIQHFAIDAESGIITVAKSLDRESLATHNLTITAVDLGTPAMTSEVVVTVNVLDVNDNPPQFSRKLYSASAAESSPVGFEVLRVFATSLDIGINAEIKFSIVGGNEHRHFTIDPQSGVISLTEPLDYERAKEFYLTIQALDGGVPPLSNHAAVNITVTDSNDNVPIFTQASYSAAIREDAAIGEPVLRVNAVDLDSGDNGRITYTLLNGDRHTQFRIDSVTGLVTVGAQLDRELIASYMLEIEARDNGSPSSLASNVLVSVDIGDANDNAPSFSQANYTAIAQEDKPLGFTILQVQVTDADGPSNASPFTFEIRSGNIDNAFRIDGNGSLRTAKRFSHKVRDSYTLQIVVFDNGSPPLFSETWVTVKVIEESKYPPIVTPLEISINSFLDEYAGGVIGRVHVSDQDPYDTLVYGLASPPKSPHQSTAPLFHVDPEDGTLIAKPGLDVGNYIVNVSVTDGKFTTYSAVKVSVVLISEEALQNAIILTVRDMTSDDFVTSYRKSFLKAIRNIMNVRTKDVFIISIQPQVTARNNRTVREADEMITPLKKTAAVTRLEPMWRVRDSGRPTRPNLDILFSVQKPAGGYYPPALVRKQLLDNAAELESTLGHRIHGSTQGLCTANFCVNGKCYDKVVLDDTMTVTVTTDISSFVAPRHSYQPTCLCKDGYSGDKCDVVANECARSPCPDSRVCRPELSPPGYSCRCPENQPGCSDGNEIGPLAVPCKDSSDTLAGGAGCYHPRHPLSFSGKSYAQYSLGSSIERHMVLTLKLRTVHPTGNLMFAAGRIDHTILEIVNGQVQFRFDCGSGEGLVRVSGVTVNDGSWHDIKLERHGSMAELIVDGTHRSQGSAPGVNDVLNLEPGNDYIFFGAEVRLQQQNLDDVRLGFVGCLDDIRMNDLALPHHVIQPSGASINSLNPQGSSSNPSIVLRRFANVEFICRPPADRPGVCGTQPCLNGGTCSEVPGTPTGYVCQCRTRFLGSRCEIDSDPCASSPCLYNGQCHNLNNDYRCECPARLSGKRCEYGRHCNPNPCKNGGICEEGVVGPICKCRGFTGDLCSVDINECEPSPCHNGGTCINIIGSFQCLCPINTTGHYCTEPALRNELIISGRYGITLEELIGIVGAVTVILLLVLIFVVCQRMRVKRRRGGGHRPHSLNIDSNGKELVPLNSTRPHGDLPDFKRNSKMSNLEVSQSPPMLPPRPASYTPSASEPTYIPLNNLDTIRSYGSAADELETYPMLGMPTFGNGVVGGHNNPDYHPNLNRNGIGSASTNGGLGSLSSRLPSPPMLMADHDGLSDSDSLHKPCWSDLESNLNLPKGYYEATKIHNDLKGKASEAGSTLSSNGGRNHHLHHMHHNGNNHYSLLNNVKSTNKDSVVMPSSGTLPPVGGAPPVGSVDDCARYHWDCSDWAHQSQNPLPNITEVPGSEIPDSSSFHSNESNESNGNAGTGVMTVSPERDLDTLVEDRQSINNGILPLDSDCGTDAEMSSTNTNPFRNGQQHRQLPSFEQILAQSGVRLSDLAIVSLPESDGAGSDSEAPSETSTLPPPGNYLRHPNLYLPPYSIASETEAEDNASSVVMRRRGHNDFSPTNDEDDDDESSSHSSFASQIHRPMPHLRTGVLPNNGNNGGAERVVSMGSCSDISNLCDIEDSEYEVEDDIRTTNHKPGQPIQTDV